MAAITKRISLMTSECDAISLSGGVGSHATLKTIFQNDFLAYLGHFIKRIEMLPVKK